MGSKSKSSLAFSLVCVSLTLFKLGPVYPKPLASSEGESRTLPLDNILAASGSEINSSADNATTGHAFIRVETLNERSTIPVSILYFFYPKSETKTTIPVSETSKCPFYFKTIMNCSFGG